MTTEAESLDVVGRVNRLLGLAEQRAALLDLELGPASPGSSAAGPGPRERARALVEHTRNYLLPRARDLDAPLVVLLLGSTGSGKSTLLNTIVGHTVSQAGVLRPTTRNAVVVATPDDARAVLGHGALGSLPRDRIELAAEGARRGIVLVDAPDIDSIEHDNRLLADALLELADLCVFVTTASRYADRVPWDVLRRIEQRGLPILVVVNRLPAGPDADVVVSDVRQLLGRTSLAAADDATHSTRVTHVTHAADGLMHTAEASASATAPALEIFGIPEGAIGPDQQSLRGGFADPLVARIDALATDRDRRRSIAEQALRGAIAGLAPLADEVARDLERAADAADRLLRIVDEDYAAEWRLLLDRLARGGVLREEVIRQWHSFVGADQITRLFSRGIGRLRGAIVTGLRGTPSAPVAVVTTGATDDVTALVLAHATDAARRTAADWSADPMGSRAVAAEPALWAAGSDIEARTKASLDGWVRSIAADVAQSGASKHRLARGVSLGVNAGAVTVMLGVFVHTGGLTGAEMGIAAATAVLNQKLMNALFGEAAVQELIERARDGLRASLSVVLEADAHRFRERVPTPAELRSLATQLRAATATETRAST